MPAPDVVFRELVAEMSGAGLGSRTGANGNGHAATNGDDGGIEQLRSPAGRASRNGLSS